MLSKLINPLTLQSIGLAAISSMLGGASNPMLSGLISSGAVADPKSGSGSSALENLLGREALEGEFDWNFLVFIHVILSTSIALFIYRNITRDIYLTCFLHLPCDYLPPVHRSVKDAKCRRLDCPFQLCPRIRPCQYSVWCLALRAAFL